MTIRILKRKKWHNETKIKGAAKTDLKVELNCGILKNITANYKILHLFINLELRLKNVTEKAHNKVHTSMLLNYLGG